MSIIIKFALGAITTIFLRYTRAPKMLSRAYKEHQLKQAAHREKQGKLNVNNIALFCPIMAFLKNLN